VRLALLVLLVLLARPVSEKVAEAFGTRKLMDALGPPGPAGPVGEPGE
jgi:hypothetical protein